jgi:hypothetical protein
MLHQQLEDERFHNLQPHRTLHRAHHSICILQTEDDKEIALISAYCPFGEQHQPTFWTELREDVEELINADQLIVTGDFNAHITADDLQIRVHPEDQAKLPQHTDASTLLAPPNLLIAPRHSASPSTPLPTSNVPASLCEEPLLSIGFISRGDHFSFQIRQWRSSSVSADNSVS